MLLDSFDRRVIEVLRVEGKPMTLAELVEATGFARSTVITHLERLCSERLVLRAKKAGEGRGRPKFPYRLAETHEALLQQSIVAMEFSNLRKACKYEKGGYCKLAKNTCTTQNCGLIVKPR